jgi:hypothetical protein
MATTGVLLTFIFTVLSPATTGAQTMVTLTIASVYADAVPPAPNMWTVLRQNGVIVATGFTPVTFNVSPGVSYTLSTADYQDIKFHHWADTGTFTRPRPVNISGPMALTAVYVSNSHPLPAPPAPSNTDIYINVNATTTNGTALSGVYTVIKQGAVVQVAKNTPLQFLATSGTTYTVRPSDYEIFASGSYTFDRWSDGTTSLTKTVTPTANVTLTALYRHNPLGLASMSVQSADLTGQPISGLRFEISPSNNEIASGNSPLSWTLEADRLYTVTPQDYGRYLFSHWEDGSTVRARTFLPSDGAVLTAFFSIGERVPPTVTILGPANGQQLTSSQATISGTASDNTGVMKVEVAIDGGPFVKADGLTKWSFMASALSNGTHTAVVRVTDFDGNEATAGVSFVNAVNGLLNKTGVYIPMYFAPTPDKQPFYDRVIAAKIAHPSVPIVAAINPASGPGSFFNQGFFDATNSLDMAGVTVIGYTPTKYGARPIADVKADIDKYVAWYPGVSGLMLDEFANSAGYETYYTELNAYAKSHGLVLVVGNAGTSPPESYVGTVDVIGITEGHGYMPTTWLQHCVNCNDGWQYTYDKNDFRFSRYAIATLDEAFVHEASKWVGLFYLTDGISPSRWTELPPYFETLVAMLDAQG